MARPENEGVLSRWSRLKRESARASGETEAVTDTEVPADQEALVAANESGEDVETVQPVDVDEPSTELPSLDELGPDSDFRGFMKPDVDDGVRRAALKQLFSDPHFNVADGLDVYAEDYTKLESMAPAMVAGLKHAQRLLFGGAEDEKQVDTAGIARDVEQPVDDEQARERKEVRAARAPQQEGEKHAVALDNARDGRPDEGTGMAQPDAAGNPKV